VSTWKPLGVSPSEQEPRRASEALDRVTRRLGVANPSTLSAVFSRWEQVVGPDVAAHATPRSLRAGVLVIVVDEPAWATQLRYLSSDLKARVDEAAGPGEVVEIQIRLSGERGSGERGSGERGSGERGSGERGSGERPR
jgi:predicted nucleic acid-binding Zn ribbon protein